MELGQTNTTLGGATNFCFQKFLTGLAGLVYFIIRDRSIIFMYFQNQIFRFPNICSDFENMFELLRAHLGISRK